MNPTRPDGSANPWYPGNSGNSFTPNIPLDPAYTQSKHEPAARRDAAARLCQRSKWRALAGGQRTDITDNKQQRLVGQIDGVIAGWDYQAGAELQREQDRTKRHGLQRRQQDHGRRAQRRDQPVRRAGCGRRRRHADALLSGNLQNHRGKVTQADGRGAANSATGSEWPQLAARPRCRVPQGRLPLGGKPAGCRNFWWRAPASTRPSLSEGTRNVAALYGELSMPLTKELDTDFGARYDNYSDFGNSTNPKVTLRYQPSKTLLLRTSYSTGFRAPSLYELNHPGLHQHWNRRTIRSTAPMVRPAPAGQAGIDLTAISRSSASPAATWTLQPEKSKNLHVGTSSVEPTTDFRSAPTFGGSSRKTRSQRCRATRCWVTTRCSGSTSTAMQRATIRSAVSTAPARVAATSTCGSRTWVTQHQRCRPDLNYRQSLG